MKNESSGITNNFPYWSISYAERFPMQKTKTKVIEGNCNPVWNDELTLTMKDPKAPIHIAMYDKDMFSNDDSMGMAEIDLW
ncbi:calcium-dependent lipid-binding (CaLB domain) family protein [Artemisia annua]|uniref:Calcium-dependent lipid-binding (CaLB domain) family protein n=1 Tax=Artemisia annua TaxID=35608 RepID=A0A2U1MRU4_ARTAN|nr:calcium-dependent lipid-binding (CaLB domain) family protein [Artemisia annua]